MDEFSNEAPPVSGDFNREFQDINNNLYNIPHKGIFHPEPNTFICRGNCCYRYVGLYPILFGLGFGLVFIPTGIAIKIIVFTLVGAIIFLAGLIVGICLSCKIKIEIKFVVSYPMIEISASSMCKTDKNIINISEIENIIFEYKESNTTSRKGVYHSLNIKYINGEQTNYFGFRSSPPCFTKQEVEYFNNEIKKLLRK